MRFGERGLQGYYVVEVASVAVLTGNVEAVEHLVSENETGKCKKPYTQESSQKAI